MHGIANSQIQCFKLFFYLYFSLMLCRRALELTVLDDATAEIQQAAVAAAAGTAMPATVN
jgi:hypothetical protein